MKISHTTYIDLPVGIVELLFDNPYHYQQWQSALVSYEPLSGTPGKTGSKSLLVYKTGKKITELKETITINKMPVEKVAMYEERHMVYIMSNHFYAVGEGKTKYEAEVEYTKFIGLLPKMKAFFLPGLLKKELHNRLHNFKTFAESTAKTKW